MGDMNTQEMNLETLELRYGDLRVRQSSMEKNLLSSLSEQGQESPVIVVQNGDRSVVIDGHKRVRALKRLKADTVRVAIWEMTEEEALVTHYRMSAYGSPNAFEEGWLIEKLHRRWAWSLGEIGKRMLKSKSWVSRRLSLVDSLPGWLTEDVLSGKIGVHAAATYLVPLTRGNTPGVKELISEITDLDLSDREIKDLTVSYQGAKAEVRKKIAADPGLFLKARAVAKADPVLNEVENRCEKNLVIIGNICLGLVKSLPEALNTESDSAARKAIHTAWVRCEEKIKWLEKTAATLFGGRYAG